MGDGLGRKLIISLVLGVVSLFVGAFAVLLIGRPPKTFRLAAGQPGGMHESVARALSTPPASRSSWPSRTSSLASDAQLARQRRVPAGYLATLYDLRTDAVFVRHKVERRIAEVGGQEAIEAAPRQRCRGTVRTQDDQRRGHGHHARAAHPCFLADVSPA